jgi:hypothetical protein
MTAMSWCCRFVQVWALALLVLLCLGLSRPR